MNDRNRDLFFFFFNEATVAITLTDEDGNDVEAQILAVIEIEELGKEYAAVLPLDIQEDEADEMEALIFVYSEDEDGNPVFESLDDAEEYEIVSSVFNQFFSEAIDEEDEEDSEDSYLDDIGDIIPGVSIQRD